MLRAPQGVPPRRLAGPPLHRQGARLRRHADGRAWFSTDEVDGPDLATFARSHALLENLSALADVAHALDYVHRAARPRRREADEREGPRRAGVPPRLRPRHRRGEEVAGIRGTPAYLAPEVLRGGKPDRRADLYALGVTFYEALTGVLPTAGRDLAASCASTSRRTSPSPRASTPGDPEPPRPDPLAADGAGPGRADTLGPDAPRRPRARLRPRSRLHLGRAPGAPDAPVLRARRAPRPLRAGAPARVGGVGEGDRPPRPGRGGEVAPPRRVARPRAVRGGARRRGARRGGGPDALPSRPRRPLRPHAPRRLGGGPGAGGARTRRAPRRHRAPRRRPSRASPRSGAASRSSTRCSPPSSATRRAEAGERPLVVLVDDLHLADRATSALLSFLFKAAESRRSSSSSPPSRRRRRRRGADPARGLAARGPRACGPGTSRPLSEGEPPPPPPGRSGEGTLPEELAQRSSTTRARGGRGLSSRSSRHWWRGASSSCSDGQLVVDAELHRRFSPAGPGPSGPTPAARAASPGPARAPHRPLGRSCRPDLRAGAPPLGGGARAPEGAVPEGEAANGEAPDALADTLGALAVAGLLVEARAVGGGGLGVLAREDARAPRRLAPRAEAPRAPRRRGGVLRERGSPAAPTSSPAAALHALRGSDPEPAVRLGLPGRRAAERLFAYDQAAQLRTRRPGVPRHRRAGGGEGRRAREAR